MPRPFPKDPYAPFDSFKVFDAKGVNYLVRHVLGQSSVCVPNVFMGDWEADVWTVDRSKLVATEYEIKCSKSDFHTETLYKSESKSAKFSCYGRRLANLPGRTLEESVGMKFVPSEFCYVLFNGCNSVDDWGWNRAPDWCSVVQLVQSGTPKRGDTYETQFVRLRKGRPIHASPVSPDALVRALSSVCSRLEQSR